MFNDSRPKLTLKKDQAQRILEYATFGLLCIALLYTVLNYNNLPEQVPMHFNLSGEVDSYGEKSFVWFPILIGFVLCIGIYKLNKYPHLFNYPDKITKENAEKHYTSAVKMMSWLNFLMALLFAVVTYQIVSLGMSGASKSAKWSEYLIYVVIAIMTFGPLIWVVKIAFTPNKK
ncbi:DUF1648 domain-containing protein [Lacinutrix chionoecetis]